MLITQQEINELYTWTGKETRKNFTISIIKRQLTLSGRVYNYWLMTKMIFSPLITNSNPDRWPS